MASRLLLSISLVLLTSFWWLAFKVLSLNLVFSMTELEKVEFSDCLLSCFATLASRLFDLVMAAESWLNCEDLMRTIEQIC